MNPDPSTTISWLDCSTDSVAISPDVISELRTSIGSDRVSIITTHPISIIEPAVGEVPDPNRAYTFINTENQEQKAEWNPTLGQWIPVDPNINKS